MEIENYRDGDHDFFLKDWHIGVLSKTYDVEGPMYVLAAIMDALEGNDKPFDALDDDEKIAFLALWHDIQNK